MKIAILRRRVKNTNCIDLPSPRETRAFTRFASSTLYCADKISVSDDTRLPSFDMIVLLSLWINDLNSLSVWNKCCFEVGREYGKVLRYVFSWWRKLDMHDA